MKNPTSEAALQALRARAEQRRVVSAGLPTDTPPEVRRLVQELQVHQIELQMQYEELLAAQAEAEASRAQYLDLYEFAPVGYCTLDAAGCLTQLNLGTAQLLGTTRQLLQHRRFSVLVEAPERPQFNDFLDWLWAHPGQRRTCELAMTRPDGTRFFAQLEGLAVAPETQAQRPATCRLVLLDTTARHQVVEALAASEARFRATFEQSRDGMALLDGHCIVDVNAAGVWMLHRTDRHLVVGHHLAEFWPEHQPDGRRSAEVLAACLNRAHQQGWCRLECVRQDPAGLPIWDEISFHPMVVQGQPQLLTVWRDITERQRLRQAERDQPQALAEAVLAAEEREKRRIAESLHNGLAQQLYAAKLGLSQLNTPQCRDDPQAFAQVYHKASQLLATAIAQTRTLSHELIPRTLLDFGLAVALQDICDDYSVAPLRMRCRVQNLPAHLPAHLLLALYRMAQELANNIVKHAQATQATLHIFAEDHTLVLRAEDNGLGFGQAQPPSGKGMGWQTLQDRVRLLQGTLTHHFQHGTHITIRVPIPA